MVIVLDPEPDAWPGFYSALRSVVGDFIIFHSLDALLQEVSNYRSPILLLDTVELQRSSSSAVAHLIDLRDTARMGLISGAPFEEFLFDLRRWGLLNVLVKCAPVLEEDVRNFIDCARNPENGFGLYRYLISTVEMYSQSVSTLEEKNSAIERVINHFATSGFDVHGLFDVRLILEETLNNALFHAFRTVTGEEKYSVRTFRCLEEGERVRLEYGNGAGILGFSVTDNAGSLPVKTIINKLERQHNKEGLFDEGGRGLYLSRMLSTAFVINVEENKRTQVVALFDDRRRLDRPKPFLVNFVGRDTFDDWRLDPEMD